MWLKTWLAGALAMTTCAALSQTSAPVVLEPVVDMSRAGDSSYFQTLNAQLVAPATKGSSAVKVRFTGSHPAWLYQIASNPDNWSGTGMALMTLTNYESFPVTVCAVFSSSTNPSDLSQSFQAPVTIAPKTTTRYGFFYNLPDPRTQGLKALPPPSGLPTNYVGSQSELNVAEVGHWRLSYQGTAPATIGMSEFDTAAYQKGFPNLVDAFFQWTGNDWSTKIHNVSDFQARLADEQTDLAVNRNTAQISGSVALPPQVATGKWGVATHNGKKFLVHPSGRLFWMFGLSGVHDAYGTMISNRSQMFESLPAATGANSSLYIYHQAALGPSGTDIFDQRVNLMRKYGTSYLQPFIAKLKERLPSWGFNTVGAFSFDSVYDGSMPFTTFLSTNAFGTRLATPATLWTTLPDPYDPKFQTWVDTTFTKGLSHYNGKSNFAGTFVDNEMSWGNITTQTPQGTVNCALGALAAGPTQPARIAFLKQLQTKYSTIGALNKAWGTAYPSFTGMSAPKNLGFGLNSTASQDCSLFETSFSNTYFSAVKKGLQTAGFQGLYLGCRFETYNQAVVSSASKYVDVLSFNHYGTADTYPWTYFNGLSKPVLISESSVGETAEGNFAGQPLAASPSQRATWTSYILREAAAQPNVIGLHWFNYSDWAATGDGDSEENYGYGVVDVCDTPHQQLVDTFRSFARSLYLLRR